MLPYPPWTEGKLRSSSIAHFDVSVCTQTFLSRGQLMGRTLLTVREEAFCRRYQKIRSVQSTLLDIGNSINRLDLLIYILSEHPRTLSTKELNLSIKANPRTIRSNLDHLINTGYLIEMKDTADSRYKYYRLSESGLKAMLEYISSVITIYAADDDTLLNHSSRSET